jgi:hypothetical protein
MILGLLRRIIAGIILLGAFPHQSFSIVLHDPRPLKDIVDRARLIVRGTVERIEVITYQQGTEDLLCGTNILMSVAETLKGASAGSLMISVLHDPLSEVYQPVIVGNEILVFAAGRSDPDPAMDELPDVIDDAPSDEKKLCLRKLSSIRPISANESAFLVVTRQAEGAQQTLKWFAYAEYLTTMPLTLQKLAEPFDKNCVDAACSKDTRRMVPWLSVRNYIRHRTQAVP